MDKSGEKWWKMEGGQGNNGTNWGNIKMGYWMGDRIDFKGYRDE